MGIILKREEQPEGRGILKHVKGKKHTDETKLKISESRKGRIISDETKKENKYFRVRKKKINLQK